MGKKKSSMEASQQSTFMLWNPMVRTGSLQDSEKYWDSALMSLRFLFGEPHDSHSQGSIPGKAA